MAIYNDILTLSKVYDLVVSDNSWPVLSVPTSIEYLVVGGGGGGGYGVGTFSGGGGGGGAGGNAGTFSQATFLNASAITITVGAGGAGGYSSNATVAVRGGNSLIQYGAITANVGVGGGQGETGPGQGGTSGNGNGPGSSDPGNGRASSGGGMGRAGYDWNDATFPGQGGYGKLFSTYDRYGTDLVNSVAPSTGKGYFGAGGSASGWYALQGGMPASYGGGGRGNTGDAGSPGLAATGGGGGGGGVDGAVFNGGAGGGGIVVIRYPTNFEPAFTIGSPNVIISGGYRYYAFTSSGILQFPV